MTLSLSIFGMASHLHWCLNPAVLFRKSLTVTASVALMFYSCSSHFGLEHNTYTEEFFHWVLRMAMLYC